MAFLTKTACLLAEDRVGDATIIRDAMHVLKNGAKHVQPARLEKMCSKLFHHGELDFAQKFCQLAQEYSDEAWSLPFLTEAKILSKMALDYENPAIFRNHLIFDPWNTPAVDGLLDERAASDTPLNKKIFISSAASDKGGFENSVRSFTVRLREREFPGLEIHERVYDVDHFQVTWASLSTAFQLLFDED